MRICELHLIKNLLREIFGTVVIFSIFFTRLAERISQKYYLIKIFFFKKVLFLPLWLTTEALKYPAFSRVISFFKILSPIWITFPKHVVIWHLILVAIFLILRTWPELVLMRQTFRWTGDLWHFYEKRRLKGTVTGISFSHLFDLYYFLNITTLIN